jgi:HEAT repeats/HEAT repeat
MNAQDIIHLLEESTDDGWQVMRQLTIDAPLRELVTALQAKPAPLTRQLLCDILGERAMDPLIDAALPVLIEELQDPSLGVRSSAVEALTKIGNPSTGDALLVAFNKEEPDEGMQRAFLTAFGAVGYRPALPLLLQALRDPVDATRQCAAWSLGELKAHEAQDPLRQALAQETDPYVTRVMKKALKALRQTSHSEEKK